MNSSDFVEVKPGSDNRFCVQIDARDCEVEFLDNFLSFCCRDGRLLIICHLVAPINAAIASSKMLQDAISGYATQRFSQAILGCIPLRGQPTIHNL